MSIRPIPEFARMVKPEFVAGACPAAYAELQKALAAAGATFDQFAAEFRFESAKADGQLTGDQKAAARIDAAWAALRRDFAAATQCDDASHLALYVAYVDEDDQSFADPDDDEGHPPGDGPPFGFFCVEGDRTTTPAGLKYADQITTVSWTHFC